MKSGFKYITKEQSAEINSALALKQKVLQAHRWLAEFDKFLEPMWSFITRENHPHIDSTRDEMRSRYKVILEEARRG
jgi:hypothetical protein